MHLSDSHIAFKPQHYMEGKKCIYSFVFCLFWQIIKILCFSLLTEFCHFFFESSYLLRSCLSSSRSRMVCYRMVELKRTVKMS